MLDAAGLTGTDTSSGPPADSALAAYGPPGSTRTAGPLAVVTWTDWGALAKPIQAEISALLPSYGATGNPIDVTAQGVHSGGLQRSIDLLDVSDGVDAILVVLSLSSDTRMPFKQAALKPVLSAQNKPIVFYSYTLPSDFARMELAASGAVLLSGLTHAGVAMRQMVARARFKAR